MGLNVKIFQKIKNNILLIVIISIFLFFYYLHYNPNADLWWDSSVYIGMGKYIYSLGETGLYEDSRPLVWPLILGFFWKMGLDAIFFGKLSVLLLGVGIIILTYFIGSDLFGKKTALLSSLLLAFSPTFFLFNSIMFAEIPSLFFSIFGIYLFIKKKYYLAGLFFGISFMTRFFQILVIMPVYLFSVYLIYKRRLPLRHFLVSISFFLAPIAPFLILNLILYNNPVYPFQLQLYMTKFTGWIYHQPFSFYFLNLIKENALILFSVLGTILIFKSSNLNKSIVPFVFLLAFIPFNFALHKEMRLLLPIFPFLYILTGYGIVKFADFFKRCNTILLFIFVLIGIIQVVPNLRLNDYDDKLDPFYEFINNNGIKNVWVSNPSFIVYSNAKAAELLYYPLYNIGKMKKLQNKLKEANYILINTCDLMPCPPWEYSCNQEHDNFIDSLKKDLDIYLFETVEECKYYILSK